MVMDKLSSILLASLAPNLAPIIIAFLQTKIIQQGNLLRTILCYQMLNDPR